MAIDFEQMRIEGGYQKRTKQTQRTKPPMESCFITIRKSGIDRYGFPRTQLVINVPVWLRHNIIGAFGRDGVNYDCDKTNGEIHLWPGECTISSNGDSTSYTIYINAMYEDYLAIMGDFGRLYYEPEFINKEHVVLHVKPTESVDDYQLSFDGCSR